MTVWKKSGSVLLAASLLLMAPLPALAGPATEVDGGAVDEYARGQVERAEVPGAAYAIVSRDGVVHQGAVGQDGDGQAVSSDTPFLWGSVSKPVTATLAVLLAGDGVLDLDARIAELLPTFATTDPRSGAATLRQFLDHTSGLPEGLELTDRYDADRDLDTVLGQIRGLDPVAEPGSGHSYSSLNYVVLAAVIERVTDRPFDEVLADRLLVPAGMSATMADASITERALPAGHRYVAGRALPFDSAVDPATVPAGYLVAGLDDLAAFARVNLTGGDVLADEERELLHTAAVATGENGGYGLGWRTGRLPGSDEPIVWHGGAAPGYQAAIVLLPQRDRAVVVLQNAYGPFHDGQLIDTAWGLAATVVGSPPPRQGVDPLYTVALAVLGVLVLALLAMSVGSVRGIVRPTGRARSVGRRLGLLAISLIALGVVVAGLLALPGFVGVTLGQLVLWAPDLAWLVWAGVVLAAALGLLRVVAFARPRGA